MNTSSKMCAIMQPNYLPWLGYFNLIDQSDVFVFLDDVQLEKNDWQTRNRIKTFQGELYLSVSRKRNRGGTISLIKETEINDSINWRKKHLKSIETAYRKTEFFDEVFHFIEPLINSNLTILSDFNINIIKSISNMIGIKKEFVVSSELPDIDGKKDERVVKICKSIGCNTYLSPVGAAGYINREKIGGAFPDNNISLYYQNYSHPTYKQLYGAFTSHMSVIDLLFNEGFDESIKIIRKGRGIPIHYEGMKS